ncbi:MAG: hypothetical protein AB8F74_04695 [Saprospiraceae bacterium]
MRRDIRNIILLLIPILTIIFTNELVRLTNSESLQNNSSRINSSEKLDEQCSWACHNDTEHCKKHHVKLLNNHFETTDPLYFGIINSMKSTGSYGLANVLIFAILVPMIIFSLFTRILDVRATIKDLK